VPALMVRVAGEKAKLAILILFPVAVEDEETVDEVVVFPVEQAVTMIRTGKIIAIVRK
jgi:3-deoxy-D-arabino-heptulosonate 7-phosphate (DAHP) synthase